MLQFASKPGEFVHVSITGLPWFRRLVGGRWYRYQLGLREEENNHD